MLSQEYKEYLRSPEWKEFRLRVISSRGRKCQRCQRKTRFLQVHHLTYARLGSELPEDVEVLCFRCHPKADERRKRKKRAIRTKVRVHGFMVKVHGPFWRRSFTWKEARRLWSSWLKRKESMTT